MNRLFRPLIIAAVTLLMLGTPALAQTPAASPEGTLAQDSLSGLQDGVIRQYTVDPTIVPSENPDEFSLVSIHVFRFDSDDQAAASWQALQESGVEQLQPTGDVGKIDINEQELDDIGDQAYVLWLSADLEEGGTGSYRALYVQDGECLYFLTAIAGNEQNTLVIDDLARFMVDREPGTSDANFNPDGTSTGGLWDLFPPTGDDILKDLIPVQDREIRAQ